MTVQLSPSRKQTPDLGRVGHGGGWAGIRLALLYQRARVGLDPGQGRVPAGALPSGRAAASALNRGRGANPASGAHPGRLSGPAASSSPPRPSDSRGRPRPPFGPGLAAAAAATRQRSAASPSPGSRRGAAEAAFHHGEPSCQLPREKMLCGSGSTGVSVAPALGVLWFCLTGAAVEVQVPEDPVVALVGTDATLRCSFSTEPGFSLAQLNLIWQLTDTKQLVHSFAEGRDQGSAYANRTALFPDLLAQGNASLRLQRVRVADEGSFTCFVSIRDFGSAAVSLQVAAPYSKPSMTLEPNKDLRPGDTVTITCSSYRGYPEAEVLWQDGQGAPLTGNVTTSQMANEQGLFDVHSVLRVVLGANGTYSCLVRNPVLQQDAHGSVTITGQPMTFPPEALWVTVGLSICLVALLVALAFVCWRKIKQSCEEENAGAEDHDGDGEGSKTALRPLKHSENKEDDGPEIV
ncbi:LOW QUALITY PROTEIN: CD276 antigen [Oryx dammah]|uniref:LOW QUALITY PROTEIN: CD276 antigen n=1 Tax=Oryx dammah TaxID=59534 RepID=UPI001A9B931A|nr:LOW QUALITY PROTEIN: CD276 antigen [Oryx dammah]